MLRLVAEAAFGFSPAGSSVTWTDITRWVDLGQEVSITRGARDEVSQIQAGTMSLTLDNSDGRFTGGNAASPYYPYVRPNCPIRIAVVTADKNLIREGSFEETSPGTYAATGWEDGDPGPISQAPSTTRAHHGTASRLISWDTSGSGSAGTVQHTLYGLEVGQQYTASGWVWVPAGSPAVRWQIEDGTSGSVSTVTDAWQQISVTFTATSTIHVLQITAPTPTVGGGSVWLDEVQVEEGAAATTFDDNFAQLHPRFYGMVGEWPVQWNGLHSTVEITATDLLKYLALQPTLQPLLVEEILVVDPAAYYPLTEPSTSVSAGDLAGVGAGALAITQVGSGGTLTFGEADGPAATGQHGALFTPSSTSVGKYLTGDMGQRVADATSGNYVFVEFWFQTTVNNRAIVWFSSGSGQFQLAFSLDSSGRLIAESANLGSPRSTYVVSATNLADGVMHHVVYDELNQDVYIDGGSAITVSVSAIAGLRLVAIGGYDSTKLFSGTIAHVALHAPPSSTIAPSSLVDHYDAAVTGFAGESAELRVLRLAGYAGIASVDDEGTFSTVASQGAGGSSALEMMREVEDTEGGKLFTHRQLASLKFQSRTVRYNPTAAFTLDYADLETQDVSMPIDDQKLVNTVVASRPGGATQRAMSSSSRDAFGPYQRELTVIKSTDNEVLDAAAWLVYRYADPQPELREVPVEAYTLALEDYRALLDADISTVGTVTGLPDEAPAAAVTVTVEGYAESIGLESHRLAFHTSRTAVDSVWVLDDPTYSVLDSTTRLAY